LTEKNWSEKQYVAAFKELKALVDGLVGAENNQGVSGGTGPFDWVGSSAEAGFKYRDALTGIAYLSMDMSERPDGWTDEYIRETTYHDSVPLDFEKRIQFFELANSEDLEPDENGVIVITGGELGELASLYEERETCTTKCELTQEDVDLVLQSIDEAAKVRDPSEPAKLNIHIPMDLLKEENETLLRALLSGIQKAVEEGKIEWATQLDAYQGYEEWKAGEL
jgi:hypothetical protein